MNNYTHFSRLRNFVKKTLLSSRKPGASAAGCRVKILQNRRPPAANYKVFAEIHSPNQEKTRRQAALGSKMIRKMGKGAVV